jgi:hypothetical protein
MRKRKAAARRKAIRPPNDTRLIKECVIYAPSIAAFHDGFKVDSDGNSCHAEALGERHTTRTRQALTKHGHAGYDAGRAVFEGARCACRVR